MAENTPYVRLAKMPWNVPLAKRHLKLDPGYAGYVAVDWALYGIIATVVASAVALAVFVTVISVRL